MADTVVNRGDRLAIKYFSTRLFMESIRGSTFRQMMKGPAPAGLSALAKARNQTMSSPDWPIQEITDLQQTAGDTVSVDLFHIFRGKPTMGDRVLEGREEPLSSSSMDVSCLLYTSPSPRDS